MLEVGEKLTRCRFVLPDPGALGGERVSDAELEQIKQARDKRAELHRIMLEGLAWEQLEEVAEVFETANGEPVTKQRLISNSPFYIERGYLSLRPVNGKMRAFVDDEATDIFEAYPDQFKQFCEAKPILQRASASKVHELVAVLKANKLVNFRGPSGSEVCGVILRYFDGMQVFVVQHDWAAAFAGTEALDDDELPLPFNECVFEFRISDRHVIVLLSGDHHGTVAAIWFVHLPCGWALVNRSVDDLDADEAKFKTMAASQIEAICIALDAQVAEREVVRASAKLNAARAKRGNLPISDYHTISPARRHRAVGRPLPDPDRDIVRKRLHFRRGHWRHFADHKTWINWMLVGDPDLGFIDKSYRL